MNGYEKRLYRLKSAAEGLVPFRVQVEESDLFILASRNLQELAYAVLLAVREELDRWAELFPDFVASLTPLALPGASRVPEVARRMYEAAAACGVGPMAAVAGAVAQAVGEELLAEAKEVIVENGGDIFAFTRKERSALIYAGSSPLSEKLLLRIPPRRKVGICTSSGTVGHSLSFGCADAVVVLAEDAAVADAAATAIGNLVHTPEDVEEALKKAAALPIEGVVIIVGDRLGAWGAVELDPA